MVNTLLTTTAAPATKPGQSEIARFGGRFWQENQTKTQQIDRTGSIAFNLSEINDNNIENFIFVLLSFYLNAFLPFNFLFTSDTKNCHNETDRMNDFRTPAIRRSTL